jgi:citrate synthase
LNGELPTADQLEYWQCKVMRHTMTHENVKKFMDGFHYDAHPMGILISTVAALSTFYPEAKNINDPKSRDKQIVRLIGKMPTLAAYAYRHRLGLPYIAPDPELGYTKNYMNMLWKRTEPKYAANPVLAHALEVLFILHADHEQNCSTSAMRAVGSSHADPFVTAAAAIAALSGPLHGGANEEVLRMLDQIGSNDNIPGFIQAVKDGKCKLMGFGHRVYKNYDPRARIIKQVAEEVFEVTGRNPKIDIALELEKIALNDEYFIKRKLYPNVDFYSGIIYQAMGFTPDQFTVLFGIPRTVGWLAQWQEMLQDGDTKIARPRQVYSGEEVRDFVPIAQRGVRQMVNA